MLCAPLDWQYAEFPSSASHAVLCSVLVRTSNQIEKEKKTKSSSSTRKDYPILFNNYLKNNTQFLNEFIWRKFLKSFRSR